VLYLKKWRKWRALPAENLADKAGIPIFEIGNVEACLRLMFIAKSIFPLYIAGSVWGRVQSCKGHGPCSYGNGVGHSRFVPAINQLCGYCLSYLARFLCCLAPCLFPDSRHASCHIVFVQAGMATVKDAIVNA
jgi:hypothetical protein